MRRILRLTVFSVLVPMTACGNAEAEQQAEADRQAQVQASEQAAADAAEEAEREAEEEAERQAEQRRFDSCFDSTTDLIDALSQIDSRLAVGLTNDEYGDYVGDARVEYDDLVDALEDDEFGPRCLQAVAIPLENALQDHIDVYNDWSDCINNYPCDFNEGDTNANAQSAWIRASDRRDKAETALDDMRPS